MIDTHHAHSALAALDRAPVWLNSEPLTADGLRGRVVLVDFWTYSCVNWLRTLPYVGAWHERYRDRGLVVVGVHAPEFGFEHDLDNVRRAVAELGVGYPVVIDNDFAIWRSFDNHYWPAALPRRPRRARPVPPLRRGRLRGDRAGDPAAPRRRRGDRPTSTPAGVAEAADWDTLESPGDLRRVSPRRAPRCSGATRARAQPLGARRRVVGRRGGRRARRRPAARSPTASRRATSTSSWRRPPRAPRSASPSRSTAKPPGDAHGVDVDESGEGTVSEPRMYQLVRQPGAVGERLFEITFLDAGRARVRVHLRLSDPSVQTSCWPPSMS